MEYFLLVYHFQLVFHMLPFKRNLKKKKKKKKDIFINNIYIERKIFYINFISYNFKRCYLLF